MTDPIALAISLAKPVCDGHLSLEAAQASIALTTHQAMKSGTLDGQGALDERLHIYNHLLDLHIGKITSKREVASGRIGRLIRPLIEMRAPKNRILAEAFNANEDVGSPLSESAVQEIAATEVYRVLQRERSNVPRR